MSLIGGCHSYSWDDLPLLPGVLEAAAAGILPGAIERNKESCSHRVVPDASLPAEMIDLCYDAQTSGGLLIAIEHKKADRFLKALVDAGVTSATVVGHARAKGTGLVHLTRTGSRTIPTVEPTTKEPAEPVAEPVPSEATSHASEEVACCADAVGSTSSAAGGGSQMEQVKARFKAFLGAASSPHGLDAYTKQAMAIALSVATRCEPCLKMHLQNARKKGFTQDEIDEAAWMGISFAGSPAMVFWESLKNSWDGSLPHKNGKTIC